MRRICGPRLRDSASSPLVFAFDCGQDALHALSEAAVVISGFETRGDLFIDDSLGQDIGQSSFETVTDLYIHFAVLNKNEESGAIVLNLLSDMPAAEDAHGVILNGRIRLHLWIDGNDDLRGGLALEVLELLIQLHRDLRRDNVRVVVEISRRRLRDHFRGNGREVTAETDQDYAKVLHWLVAGLAAPPPKLNCTFGGVSAPGWALK